MKSLTSVLILATLAAVACGRLTSNAAAVAMTAPPTARAVLPATGPNPTDNPPLEVQVLTHTHEYVGMAMKFEVPPVGAHPALTPDQVWARCTGGCAPSPATQRRLWLTSATNINFGFTNVLAWAVVSDGVPLTSSGPARPGGSPPVRMLSCEYVALIDANSGATLIMFDNCPGPDADKAP